MNKFLIFFVLLFSKHGAAEILGTLLHARAGYLGANIDRPPLNPELVVVSVDDSKSALPVFDLEFEVFVSNRRSAFVRYILALDFSTTKNIYSYTGIGQRFYVFSKGPQVSEQDQGTFVGSSPQWRYYLAWDLGISRMIIGDFGTVLELSSTLLDLGGRIGIAYSVVPNINIEANVGAAFGYGFSSVAVNSLMLRAFLGTSFNF